MERLCSFVTRARGSLSALVRDLDERGFPKRTFLVSYAGALSVLSSLSEAESSLAEESEDDSSARECCRRWEWEEP